VSVNLYLVGKNILGVWSYIASLEIGNSLLIVQVFPFPLHWTKTLVPLSSSLTVLSEGVFPDAVVGLIGPSYFLTVVYSGLVASVGMVTFGLIEEEIRSVVKKYIPNLDITKIEVKNAEEDLESGGSLTQDEDERLFRVSDESTKPYTAKVKIEYTINNGTFTSSDFVIINI
jgi:hypothetical protein